MMMMQNPQVLLVSFLECLRFPTSDIYTGTRIARVRVIFKLPDTVDAGVGKQDAPTYWPKTPLAYVEWYKPLRRQSDATMGMFVVKKTSTPTYSIIPIGSIRQSCMLLPKFDPDDDWHGQGWKKENVLDLASIFYLNNWQSSYAYQTLW